jgi:hypothetical protein
MAPFATSSLPNAYSIKDEMNSQSKMQLQNSHPRIFNRIEKPQPSVSAIAQSETTLTRLIMINRCFLVFDFPTESKELIRASRFKADVYYLTVEASSIIMFWKGWTL